MVIKGKVPMKKVYARWLIGSNYWQRNSGINMWREWSPELVRDELAQARQMGCRVIRVFLLWADFQPTAYKIDNDSVRKFDELLAIAREMKLQLVPTFFTGHMSNQNFDIAWRADRDPYADPLMLKAEEHLVRFFAERYRQDPNIMFWDICNEPAAFYAPEDAEIGSAWVMRMSRAVKECDNTHLVTLGYDLDSVANGNGFDPDKSTASLDFVSAHVYPEYSDLCPEEAIGIQGSYLAGFTTQLAQALSGKPVLIEEFGVSNCMCSEDIAAYYYRMVLPSIFANEAIGAFSWCLTDFTCNSDEPYNSFPFESQFGMTDTSGRIKACGHSFKKFAGIATRFDMRKLKSTPRQAAILIPRTLYDDEADATALHDEIKSLFNSFILAKQAGLEPKLILPEEDFRYYRLLILPCVPSSKAITWADWQRVSDFVAYGGTLLASFNGCAVGGIDELFGFRRQFFKKDMGSQVSIIPTTALRNTDPFLVDLRGLPRLFVDREFSMMAHDEDGSPLATYGTYGDGNTIFVCFPLELVMAREPYLFKTSEAHKIYEHAAALADLVGPFIDSRPDIEYRRFNYDGRDMMLLVNHGPDICDLNLRPEYANLRPIFSEKGSQGGRLSIGSYDYLFLMEEK